MIVFYPSIRPWCKLFACVLAVAVRAFRLLLGTVYTIFRALQYRKSALILEHNLSVYCALFLVLTCQCFRAMVRGGNVCTADKKRGEIMLVFRFDVLQALKEKGISTYYLRKNTTIGQKTIADIKNGIVPGIKSIDILCGLLDCQPGDMIEYRK